MRKTQTIARTSLVLLAAPGLAFALARVARPSTSDIPLAVTVLLLLVAGAILLFRCASETSGEAAFAEKKQQLASIVLVASVAIVSLSWRTVSSSGMVLLAVCVEEIVFRQQIPAVATPMLEHVGLGNQARTIAILASQLDFALAHFVVPSHRPMFAAGAPLLALISAGCFLAVIYELSDLTIAIVVHFALNMWIMSRRFGQFEAPSARTQLALLALAVAAVIGSQWFVTLSRHPAEHSRSASDADAEAIAAVPL